MQKRSPIAVFLLSFLTLGIYSLIWQVKTKTEMNKLGANIPTAWLIIIPFVNIYWVWKYSEGVELVTRGKTTTVIAFLLLAALGVAIGGAVIQNDFNKLNASSDTQAQQQPTPFTSVNTNPTPQPFSNDQPPTPPVV